jgi:hypothetical protein
MFAKYHHFSCRAPLTSMHSLLRGPECRVLLCLTSDPIANVKPNAEISRKLRIDGISPPIYVSKNLYREETRAALTDVKISANEIAPHGMKDRGVALMSCCPA